MDIALQFGFVGIFILVGMAVAAYAPRQRHAHGKPTEWSETARSHLPYATLTDDERARILDRDDFQRAVIYSIERQWNKPAALTQNELDRRIREDVTRRAGDILLPQEIGEVVSTAEHNIQRNWDRYRKRKSDT